MNASFAFNPEVEIMTKAAMRFPAKQRRITTGTPTLAH
jgi:hypothetical protein